MAKTSLSEDNNFIKSEIYVQAGVPITLATFKVQSGSIVVLRGYSITTLYGDQCSNIITFTPNENSDYEVILGESKVSCAASVNKIAESQGASSLTPIQFSQSATCTNKERSWPSPMP
jgi:hypothetical protein